MTEIMKNLRHIAFGAYHCLISRDGMMDIWREYKKAQWKNRTELRRIQEEKLTNMLIHCMRNVPYYRRIFEVRNIQSKDLKKICILNRLPLLDKITIRDNFNQLQSENIPQWRVKKNSTSGSTGESLIFNVDVASASTRMAATFRNYDWCKVSPFAKQTTLWGARFDEPDTKSFADKLRAWTRPNLFLSSYKMTESQMGDYAKLLRGYQPQLLTSYPSPLEHFAYFCERCNVQIPSLRAIICSAEQLTEIQRELFEKVFRVPVFNRYGSREFGNVAHECEHHNGLHINIERVIIEVLREDGSECKPGEIGELVITDLDNEVMPFIRYRIGDMGSWSEKECPCGRGLPLLEKIEGRVFDLIHTPSGNSISGTFWTLLLRHISQDIVAFQVRQESIDRVEILLQTSCEKLPEELERTLLYKIADEAPDLEVHIKYVNEIPLTKSGKRRFVISNIA